MSEVKEKTTGELFVENLNALVVAVEIAKSKLSCSDELAFQIVNQALSVTGAFGIGSPAYSTSPGCAPKRESLKVPNA